MAAALSGEKILITGATGQVAKPLIMPYRVSAATSQQAAAGAISPSGLTNCASAPWTAFAMAARVASSASPTARAKGPI